MEFIWQPQLFLHFFLRQSYFVILSYIDNLSVIIYSRECYYKHKSFKDISHLKVNSWYRLLIELGTLSHTLPSRMRHFCYDNTFSVLYKLSMNTGLCL